MRTLNAAALAFLALAACHPSDDADQAPTDDVGHAPAAIINGTNDNTHQAVVAYLQGGKCTATIVAVDGGVGYALTAAHCIGGNLGVLRQGNSHADNAYDVEYNVTAAEVHPEYGESTLYDLAMLQFSGANGGTPVLPPLPPAQDNINVGTQLDLVGYGQTESGGTVRRKHIVLPVDFESATRLRYDQTTGGICSGDSGGAALHTVGNTEYVAGVHSFVSGGCDIAGTSIRVSFAHDTFIMPYINGTPYVEESCEACTDAHAAAGQCAADVNACFSDTACSDYVDCRRNCGSQPCLVTCGNDHAAGKTLYDQIFGCLCSGPCATECAGSQQCAPEPACDLTSSVTECQTCFETSCCAQTSACAADETCFGCLDDPIVGPECFNSSIYTDFQSCLANNCSDVCDVDQPMGTGGAGGGGEGGGAAGGNNAGGAQAGAGGALAQTTGAGAGNANDDPLVVEDGCACSTAPTDSSHRWLVLALAAAALRLRRREK